jgi:hypothetical protein
MTDAELLHHYIARERIIFGGERSPGHCRLREFGFIEEHPTSRSQTEGANRRYNKP